MNGPGMQAFMEAFQRTSAMLDQRDQQRQMTQVGLQDRQRTITRQDAADKAAQEDRAARQAQQAQADALQRLQIPGHLAELGGTADSPQGAQQLIETALPELMRVFGQETMAFGQPAVEMAQRTITARQKRQVSEFVEKALKTSYVAENPESDPEVQNLPAHIASVLGKPSARLSELQQFAELPVGKPPGKERMPAAAGSFEDFVQRKYGPNPTAEQILEGRKVYQQVDDRPTVNVTLPGGISGKAGDAALKFQDDYARDSKPYVTLRDAYQRVQSAAAQPNAAGDLSMIFAYMKMLDPNSVVREQEFANAQNAAGVPDRIRNAYNRVMQGTRLTPEQRAEFLGQAESLFANAVTNQKGVRRTYGDRAGKWGIPADMVLDAEDDFVSGKATRTPPAPSAPPQNASGPKVGERRKIRGQLAEWDGNGWLPVVK